MSKPKASFLNQEMYYSDMKARNAMEPFGYALRDFYYSGKDESVIIIRDDGYHDEMSVRKYFRTPEEFSHLENKALELCKGKIIDLSAGVGADCLELQKRGFDVTAVEINPEACEIMKRRGIKKVKCMDLFEFSESKFDTILLFDRSIGNVQNLEGLERFLFHAKLILKSTGQLIFDSLDVRKTKNPKHLAYQQNSINIGRYYGEVIVRFEYKGIIGSNFGLLHVDPDTLRRYTNETGWNCELIYSEDNGNFLARLTIL